MPKRIKMSRQKPWRDDNPDAVKVDRTTPYGNPFRVVRGDCDLGGLCWKVEGPAGIVTDHFEQKRDAADDAVRLFANWMSRAVRDGVFAADGLPDYFGAMLADRPTIEDVRVTIGGRDVACWCGLDDPCHGDVYLRIGNPAMCPECRDGKPWNCIGWTLDADDNEVPCTTRGLEG